MRAVTRGADETLSLSQQSSATVDELASRLTAMRELLSRFKLN